MNEPDLSIAADQPHLELSLVTWHPNSPHDLPAGNSERRLIRARAWAEEVLAGVRAALPSVAVGLASATDAIGSQQPHAGFIHAPNDGSPFAYRVQGVSASVGDALGAALRESADRLSRPLDLKALQEHAQSDFALAAGREVLVWSARFADAESEEFETYDFDAPLRVRVTPEAVGLEFTQTEQDILDTNWHCELVDRDDLRARTELPDAVRDSWKPFFFDGPSYHADGRVEENVLAGFAAPTAAQEPVQPPARMSRTQLALRAQADFAAVAGREVLASSLMFSSPSGHQTRAFDFDPPARVTLGRVLMHYGTCGLSTAFRDDGALDTLWYISDGEDVSRRDSLPAEVRESWRPYAVPGPSYELDGAIKGAAFTHVCTPEEIEARRQGATRTRTRPAPAVAEEAAETPEEEAEALRM